jgi:uncharacterized membrane protein YgcG
LEQQLYLEAYQMGVIDQIEALKKLEIFDLQGVIQRSSLFAKMQEYIAQLEQQVKDLGGDLQTATRARLNAEIKAVKEKVIRQLNEIVVNAKANKKVELAKLQGVIQNLKTPQNGGVQAQKT